MRRALLAFALSAAVIPALALQSSVAPAAEASAVKAGSYKADPGHTQVVWTLNHLGISLYRGMFGDISGTLTIDPAKPGAAAVSVSIPVAKVVTTSAELDTHLGKADFFDVAQFPTATFTSTKVVASGNSATITGNLTLHGVTKPVVLDAKFTGMADNPMTKKPNIGFEATAKIKRSDFGINKYMPMLGDDVDLWITAAFEGS
ncbi:MAG TPA: YceI family protein [Dongiaceae bacterium]|nr:YceI family protein [Allosphingosinicella sp.]HKP24919.1 YceI family protein [Dongiaceae bacterium]